MTLSPEFVETAIRLRLRNVRASGKQLYASCPFHDDKTASLSLSLERMAWKCHAGCHPNDGKVSFLLEKLGVKFVENKAERKIEKVYPYHDASGKLVYEVVRYNPKGFAQRHYEGGKVIWGMEGVTRVPYRLPELLSATRVFLVEGEKDADRLASLGLTATTTAGGSSSWKEDFSVWFAGKQVIIIPDNDEPGEKYSEAAKNSLSARSDARIFRVGMGKDVSDFLDKHGTKEDFFASLKVFLEKAKEEPEDRVVSSWEKREQIEKSPKVHFAAKTGIRGLDELVGGLRGGEMNVISGKSGNGKTLLCQTLTANLKAQEKRALWFTYEVPEDQFLEQMPKDLLFFLPNQLKSNSMDWIRAKVKEGQDRHGTSIVFIDHLHYLIDMEKLRNPALEIGALVRSIKRMAIEFDIVVFLVAHVRNIESGKEATDEDLRDSGFTKCEADGVWMVSRLMDKATQEATEYAKLTVRKCRKTGTMGKSICLFKSGLEFKECDFPLKPIKPTAMQRNFLEPKEAE